MINGIQILYVKGSMVIFIVLDRRDFIIKLQFYSIFRKEQISVFEQFCLNSHPT